MTDLEPIAPGILRLAQQGEDVDKVMTAMLSGTAPLASPAQDLPPVANPIGELSEDAKLALKTLIKVFGQVNPDVSRVLTHDELVTLGQEDLSLRIVAETMAKRHEQVKELVRHHADRLAEQENAVVPHEVRGLDPVSGEDAVIVPATLRDKNGHYLHSAAPKSPHQIPIPGTSKAWSLEFHGNGVEYDMVDLARMLADGEISRHEYYAMTRRVFDPVATQVFMTKKPARALEILRRITRLRTPANYLYVRNQK